MVRQDQVFLTPYKLTALISWASATALMDSCVWPSVTGSPTGMAKVNRPAFFSAAIQSLYSAFLLQAICWGKSGEGWEKMRSVRSRATQAVLLHVVSPLGRDNAEAHFDVEALRPLHSRLARGKNCGARRHVDAAGLLLFSLLFGGRGAGGL